MTPEQFKKISWLLTAWIIACDNESKGSMTWTLDEGLEGRDARYLFQLYFKHINCLNPRITARGMERLNKMWKLCHNHYDRYFILSKYLDRKYKGARTEYNDQQLEY